MFDFSMIFQQILTALAGVFTGSILELISGFFNG